ncbi:MAG: GMP synthase, partial [Calditrichae bacterium]|nr:GMP synthase [Calditrichia bacterium]
MEKQTINVAILDLYDNEPNHGIRCIKELVTQSDAQLAECSVKYRVYKVRYKAEVPGMDHDIYIST